MEKRPIVNFSSPSGEKSLWRIVSCSLRGSILSASHPNSLKQVPQALKTVPSSEPLTSNMGVCAAFVCSLAFDFCQVLPSVLLIHSKDWAYMEFTDSARTKLLTRVVFFTMFLMSLFKVLFISWLVTKVKKKREMEEQICNRYYDWCNKKEQVSE